MKNSADFLSVVTGNLPFCFSEDKEKDIARRNADEHGGHHIVDVVRTRENARKPDDHRKQQHQRAEHRIDAQ